MMLIFMIVTLFFTLSQASLCNYDNCLNAFIHTSTLAKPFCSTYTKFPGTTTYALPNYATACKGIPSRVSSACSCLNTVSSTTHASATFTTTLATSTTFTRTPTSSITVYPTCSPAALKDPTFAETAAGGGEWIVTVNQAPGQSVLPEWSLNTGLFSVDFPNFQPDPFLSTVTLSQSGYHVCDGPYNISYTYATMINAIAANPVPEVSNCTITSGFTNVPASLRVTPLPLETANQTPSSIQVNYEFEVLGLPLLGSDEELYFIFECYLDDWWPGTYFSAPGVQFGT